MAVWTFGTTLNAILHNYAWWFIAINVFAFVANILTCVINSLSIRRRFVYLARSIG